MQIVGKISRADEWSTLRKVGNASAAKLAILVPFVGWLILFSEKLQPYIALSQEIFSVPSSGTASPRLVILYLALCFISVASIGYSLFCPPQVKRYETPEEYTGRVLPVLGVLDIRDVERKVVNGDGKKRLAALRETLGLFDDGAFEAAKEVFHSNRDALAKIGVTHLQISNYYGQMLSIYFNMLDNSYPRMRRATLVCYGVGFLGLGLLALDVFVRVALHLPKTLGLL